MKKSTTMLFAALIFAAFGMKAFADDPTIEAIADVTSQLLIESGNNLVFGNVVPGVNKAIGVTDNVVEGVAGGTTESTGTFNITKGANTQVTLTLTLPAFLTRIGGGEQPTMPITFTDSGANQLGQWVITGGANQSFTPASTTYVTSSEGGIGGESFESTNIQLRLGGRVEPVSDQGTGQYRGNIVLTGVYN